MSNPASPFRIVIVDDESLARRGLQLRLKDIEGVEVIAECANGREALAVWQEQPFDLILMDCQRVHVHL